MIITRVMALAGLMFFTIALVAIPSSVVEGTPPAQHELQSPEVNDSPRKYDYSWESLRAHPIPKWFDDAKFGIFIHWGPSSVIGHVKGDRGYVEWVARRMYSDAGYYYPYLKEHFGAHPPEFGYKDFIDKFKAENWDPDDWAELFDQAGAKYVVLTAEHHDGYAMWDSELTDWTTTKMGPMRDLVGDLGKAVRKRGLKYAPSYHRERHSFYFAEGAYRQKGFPFPGVAEEIKRVPEAAALYGPFEISDAFIEDYVARWKEIEEKYQPDLMWLDHIPFFHEKWCKDFNHPQVQKYQTACMKMIADYFNASESWGKQVCVNNKGPGKLHNWPSGVGFREADNLTLKDISTKWQNPATLGTSYGYSRAEEENDAYKSSTELVHLLCDVVSKNGNLLLNIGPRSDGTIPEGMRERLLAIGKWLTTNGEAIYGTRPWDIAEQREPNLRFTTKGETLFAIALDKPTEPFTIRMPASRRGIEASAVSLLGSKQELEWRAVENGIEITPPADIPGEHAWTFKVHTSATAKKKQARTNPSASQKTDKMGLDAQPDSSRVYEIWEPKPANNRGGRFQTTEDAELANSKRPFPYDEDWEKWSYCIGNGYMGANLFGRVDTERIQITEKTLHNKGPYNSGGLTSFAELYLDLNHGEVDNYRRSLNLNEAIAHVRYEKDGVGYRREYFMSYPDNVLVVHLSADRKGALSLAVRPVIPYLNRYDQRTGSVVAEQDLIVLSGKLPFFNINFEGQIKVLHEGGTLQAGKHTIAVRNADSVTLLIGAGTNYELGPHIFSRPDHQKLDAELLPHDAVSALIANAAAKGYHTLRQRHLEDYQNLFQRVAVNLNSTVSADPTSTLLKKYKAGETNTYLEELMFQYARYLLIASSRETTLPSNLQGTWSQYQQTPWSGGYWHNINVQMNYWGVMSANLAECFEAYIAYFKAYLPEAQKHARDYVKQHNPSRLVEGEGQNGWILGTGANAYRISGPGSHSGPGTGGFTSKLLMEYYLYTLDQQFLEEVAYPAMISMSRFFSKALVPHGELLLIEPSASPEQVVRNKSQLDTVQNPGHVTDKGYYVTAGCTFDQGFVWENFNDTLILAEALGKQDEFLRTIRENIDRLDPIQIGTSGQIKEFREEQAYSDIGDPVHRHISHLCPLYPGTLISSEHPEWMNAAKVSLDKRGNNTTGWAMAHRMNCRARLKQGEEALKVYRKFIAERTVPNLWTLHPPFQIDGNFGSMAGVVEMLLQSHEGHIEILPALPQAWHTGHFEGLVARGNFVCSVRWREGNAYALSVTSRSGGPCRIAYDDISSARVTDSQGRAIKTSSDRNDRIQFNSVKAETYNIALRGNDNGE